MAKSELRPAMLPDGAGLYLRVHGGAKSWIYRYAEGGREHHMGLGPYPVLSLAAARDKAMEVRRLRLDGYDPLVARRACRVKAVSFRDCAERYMDAHEAGWKNAKHRWQWSATLGRYAYPAFGDLAVQQVDVGLVLHAIEPIWATKAETASRVRGRIEAVLDWATARGYRVGDNPARWKGHLDNLLPPRGKVARVRHHAALPYAELAAFMVGLRGQGGVAARCLEYCILTAARTGEAIGATWQEIDLEARTWTIPGGRMKAGREHRTPLSGPALSILEALPRTGGLVFPLSNMAMLTLLRRMGRNDLTVHGFRSSFSDWCAEMTNYPAEVREMALAHAVGDKVEAAYRRGDLFDKRRQLADAWARYCSMPAPTGEVVAIRAS